MKPIKFVNKDKPLFAAALRKNVNDYFKEKGISVKGDKKMIVKIVVMFSLFLVPFILLLTAPLSAWMIFPVFILMGIGMAGTGMSVMHDAAHSSLSKKNWLNKLLAQSVYMIGGNVFTWRIQHNVLHHTYTNIAGHDEDIEARSILRFSQHSPLKKIHRFQYVYAFLLYSLMTISKLIKDFFQLREYNKSGITRQQKAIPANENAKMIVSKIVYLFIVIGLPLLLTSYSWWLIVLGFLIMHMVAAIIMSTVFQLAHLVEGVEQPLVNGEGNIENEWIIHELQTTSNFARNSRIVSWFIGGLNYQIEHHLFPGICHVHYKKIAPIVEKTAHEYGLNYNVKPTLIDAIISHIRILKALGRQAV